MTFSCAECGELASGTTFCSACWSKMPEKKRRRLSRLANAWSKRTGVPSCAIPRHVNFFSFCLPVLGEAKDIELPGGTFRFWTVVTRSGINVTMREKVRSFNDEPPWSLQERMDHFGREITSASNLPMCNPLYVVPATDEQLGNWSRHHYKDVTEG